jgi:hypothetical protein
VNVTSVTFTYEGKEDDFLSFLRSIVRDYLTADDPAKVSTSVLVDKVESSPV